MPDTAMSDPCLAAMKEVQKAESQFLSVPVNGGSSEDEPCFIKAEQEWGVAEEKFADAVPTTPAGALAKLDALKDLHRAMPMDEDSLEIRHVEALMAYVDRLCRNAQ